MRTPHLRILPWVLALVCCTPALAELRLARILTDHAVLQRDKKIPVWGWAGPGETVTVEFAGQKVKGQADTAGKWLVWLTPLPASSERRELTVIGATETRVLKDVLVGDSCKLGRGDT